MILAIAFGIPAFADDAAMREWTDISGRFRINARLIEVRDGTAFLENTSGQTIKIPVSRLSQADQRYLETGSSPFEIVGGDDSESAMDSPSQIGRSPRSSGGSGATDGNWMADRVAWSRVRKVVPDFSRWKAPGARPIDGFVPKRASLPRKSNFHESAHPIVVNAAQARAVVGHTVSFAVDEPTSRVSLIDLKTGRSVSSDPTPANMKPIALLDDGTSMLAVGVARRSDDGETADTVQLWRLRNRRLSKSSSWVPYPDEDKSFGRTSNGNVASAGAIDDELFYTISENGHLAVWNLATERPVWHFQMSQRHFDVALSPSRESMAIVDEKSVLLVESATGFVIGGSQVPEDGAFDWPKIRWSPDAQMIYVGAAGRMHRLDAVTGTWFDAYDTPVRSMNQSFQIPASDFALLDAKTLVHLPTSIDVATYDGMNSVITVGDHAIVVVQQESGGLVMPVQFPTPAAAALLDAAVSQPNSFLVHPGAQVAIDVSGVPTQHRDRVATDLKHAAMEAGYDVRDQASLNIVGRIGEPFQDAIHFQPHGSYIVTKMISSVELTDGQNVLWQARDANIGPMVSVPFGGSFELTLERLGKTPNLNVFSAAKFPKYIAGGKDNESSPSLTTATFTLRGLIE
jgi:hypothetical protein